MAGLMLILGLVILALFWVATSLHSGRSSSGAAGTARMSPTSRPAQAGGDASTYKAWGIASLKREEYQQAIADLSEAIRMAPDDAEAYY
jgi:Flp pilus assembly protein TadD